jgi:hypothetical protein
VHHFENGVWIYRHDVLRTVKSDMEHTIGKSIKMEPELIKNTLLKRFIRAVVYVISPLL